MAEQATAQLYHIFFVYSPVDGHSSDSIFEYYETMLLQIFVYRCLCRWIYVFHFLGYISITSFSFLFYDWYTYYISMLQTQEYIILVTTLYNFVF